MLSVAMAEVGVIDRDRGQITDKVREYLRAAGVDAIGDRPPYWGGAFLAWCAVKSGVVPPLYPSEASSWEAWSEGTAEPSPGCVVVLADRARPLIKHVGLIVRRHAGRAYVIGGDHGGAVNIQRCEDCMIIAARRPPNVVAVPQPSAQTVDVRVTVDRGDAGPAVYSNHPVLIGSSSVSPEQIEALRLSVVSAIAAAAETQPNNGTAVAHLAELAAMATAATTKDGIESARDKAVAYITRF